VNRRAFIGMLGGAAVLPLMARAQSERMRVVGVISNIPEEDAAMKARFAAFRQELEGLGWLQSRNVRIETRFGAVTPEQIHASAKELLALQPDVILANAPGTCQRL
jgi:putative tryptophan/tyrosine transport system substrate-binding protein